MIINRKAIALTLLPKIDKLKKMFEDKLKNNEERNHGKAKVLKKEFIFRYFV
jgi:hypothetical protein